MKDKQMIEEEYIVELTPRQQHLINLMATHFTDYMKLEPEAIIVELIETGLRQQHPYFQIYENDYQRLSASKRPNCLSITKS